MIGRAYTQPRSREGFSNLRDDTSNKYITFGGQIPTVVYLLEVE